MVKRSNDSHQINTNHHDSSIIAEERDIEERCIGGQSEGCVEQTLRRGGLKLQCKWSVPFRGRGQSEGTSEI